MRFRALYELCAVQGTSRVFSAGKVRDASCNYRLPQEGIIGQGTMLLRRILH